MHPTDRKAQIQAIVNVFETGKAVGEYGTCVVLPDGAGISYGRSQATDRDDALDAIVARYIADGGPRAADLAGYMKALHADATAKLDPQALPPWCVDLMRLLRELGADPVMRRAQDAIFDAHYWNPAVEHARDAGVQTPLGLACFYDTAIHSGPGMIPKMRARFPERAPARGGDERAFVAAYVRSRRLWLSSFANPAVAATVYRMDALADLITRGAWSLDPPFDLRVKSRTIRIG